MIKLKDDASTLFFKSYFELQSKKDKAVKQADWSKFNSEIEASGIPKEELKGNHVIAKHVIMKDVTNSKSTGKRKIGRNEEIFRVFE